MSINGDTLGDAIRAAVNAAVAAHPSSSDPSQRVELMRAMGSAIAAEVNAHGLTLEYASVSHDVGHLTLAGTGVGVVVNGTTATVTITAGAGPQGPQGPPGPAPYGSANDFVILASSGVATSKTPAQVQALLGIVSPTFAAITVADSPYTPTPGVLVDVDTSGGNVTVNMPAAVAWQGATIIVRKVTPDSNTVTLVPNGAEKINGEASVVVQYQWSSASLRSTGASLAIT